MLANETYSFTVRLCNFLQRCHTSSASVKVSNSHAIPVVTVIGNKKRELQRSNSLSILTSAYVGVCNSTNRYYGMSLAWKVFRDGDHMQHLSSVSRNSFRFLLPGHMLSVGSYLVTVTVVDTLFGGHAHSVIAVDVIPSDVIAVIAGGAHQTWQAIDGDMIIDGSHSYDEDIGQGLPSQGLSFFWTCDHNESTVLLQDSFCDDILPVSMQRASNISLRNVNGAVGATFALTLMVEGSFNRSASTKVFVTISESFAPKILLVAYPYKINSLTPLRVTTSVRVSSYATGLWSVNDNSINLGTMASMPSLQKVFPQWGSYSLNLALGRSALEPGSVYDFELSVTGSEAVSSTLVSVIVVDAPQSGDLNVIPLSGSEFSNLFDFVTSQWTDHELPLSYSFGYFSKEVEGLDSMLQLQRRGGASTMGEKFLPRGLAAYSYNLTCGVYAFNNLDAKSFRTMAVRVDPIEYPPQIFEESVIAHLSNALENRQDMSEVKSVVSVGVSILNAVNCSSAPIDCEDKYRREACVRNTPHTCGPCLEGYVGESEGDANSPCHAVSSSDNLNLISPHATCAIDDDCRPMQTCMDTRCMYSPKSCAMNCSGHGKCHIRSKLGGIELEECLVNDFSCRVFCICEDGYFGGGCSDSQSAIESKRRTRYELISHLNSSLQMEDEDVDMVIAQANLVTDLGSSSSELTEDSCLILQDTIGFILRTAGEVGASVDTFKGVLGALSNCDHVYVDNSRPRANGRTEASSSKILKNSIRLRAQFNNLASQSMIVGEKNLEFIDTYSRSTILKDNINKENVQSVPRTQLEDFFSIDKTSVRFMGAENMENVEDITRSVILEETDSELFANTSAFSAHPLKVKYFLTSSEEMSPNIRSPSILVVFQNIASLQYVTNSSNSSLLLTTNCQNWTIPSFHNYTCPNGDMVTHHCTHLGEIMTTICPALQHLPTCRILATNYQKDSTTLDSCRMVGYTSTNVTCNCTILLEHSSGTRVSERRGSTSAAEESSGYVEVAAMSEYTYQGFISTNSEITQVSMHDIRASLLIITMYSILWGCGLLGMYELFRSHYCCAQRKTTPDDSENFASEDIGNFSLEDRKKYLLQHIDSALPFIFQSLNNTDSTLSCIWKTIVHHHRYAVVFTASGPTAKDIRIYMGIYLLTIQSMLMFIMAVVCDLQVPFIAFVE